MRYPIDIAEEPKESLLFWITKYIKHKINTLSHSKTRDKSEIERALKELSVTPDKIETIDAIVRRLRTKGGFDGVKTFYLPVKALYKYIETIDLNSLKDIDDELLVDFLTSSTATYSDATKKNYRNAIINFFGYISKQNENEEGSGNGFIYHLNISSWQGLSGKSGKVLPDHLNEEEIKQMFDYMKTQLEEAVSSKSHREERSWVFYSLLVRFILYTGIRISEALSIEREKIQRVTIPDEGEFLIFKIHGKGNNNRKVALNGKFVEPYYSQWLSDFSYCDNEKLFCAPSNSREDANPSSISTKIKKILRGAGISKNKEGAHLLRHTFGTLLYSKTQDLALVQDALGHNDPKTTRVYTHINHQATSKISNAFSDLE